MLPADPAIYRICCQAWWIDLFDARVDITMKKTAFYLFLLISLSVVMSCRPPVQHTDPFYNYDDFTMNRIPLINPVEANRPNSDSPWNLELDPAIWIVDYPNNRGFHYPYASVEELEKFAVENGIVMAYSSYVNKDADAYIQDNYYHWFVMVPADEITKGFQTEDAFLEHIQTLGVEDPDWQMPDEAFQQFRKTGCLAWIPDCP